MFWVLGGLAVCTAIVLAGRAHSRRLDARDEELWKKNKNQ